MATPPDAVRAQLTVITAAATADLTNALATTSPSGWLRGIHRLLPLIVPSYFDTAGTLAADWYEERRDESRPSSSYVPTIIGDPATDWIERELADFQRQLEGDLELEMQRLLDETNALVEKEIARGFRESIVGNARQDEDAIGWSRVARPGACKLCTMLADKGAVYSQETARFAAHLNCHCAARPEFRNGDHGPEASVEQYLASRKRRTPKEREQLRAYLNQHYPDAPG